MNVYYEYIFKFDNEYAARTNPVTGPYFNPTNAGMLLNLWVYDLNKTMQTLSGYWFLIQQPALISNLSTSPFLKLLFSYPGPILVQNNLDMSPDFNLDFNNDFANITMPVVEIGEKFEIIAGQFALSYINNWSQRLSFHQ